MQVTGQNALLFATCSADRAQLVPLLLNASTHSYLPNVALITAPLHCITYLTLPQLNPPPTHPPSLWPPPLAQSYTPRASLIPAALDFTTCPYTWPYCRQPLYYGALPVVINATILNGMGVIGSLQARPVFKPTNELGKHLYLDFRYSEVRQWISTF